MSRRPSVLTVGNFDGIHLGHQAILKQLTERAQTDNYSPQILVFEPQPREFFSETLSNETVPPSRLMSWREKYRILSTFGLARLNLMQFDEAFSALSPEAFVDQVLLAALNVRHLIVGEDFRFGSGRSGDLNFLVDQGKHKGFEVEKASTYQLNVDPLSQGDSLKWDNNQACTKQGSQRRVSSTWVRSALQEGNLKLASMLIGRPYELSGRVIQGQQLGRTWGFPTANVKLSFEPALSGVFAVSANELSGTQKNGKQSSVEYFGVANLGRRPTLGGVTLNLEVHLFDFNGDLYGKRLCVKFHQKIRDEKKFDSTGTLVEAIREDHAKAKQFWHDHTK